MPWYVELLLNGKVIKNTVWKNNKIAKQMKKNLRSFYKGDKRFSIIKRFVKDEEVKNG